MSKKENVAQIKDTLAIDPILKILDEIREPLLELGYKQSTLAYKRDKLDKASPHDLQQAYAWLVGFQKVYMGGYLKAIAMVPQSVWTHYESIGLKGTQEQLARITATKLLKAEWAKRPKLIRKYA